MFAIVNKKTSEFIYGTDFNHNPHLQRTAKNQALLFAYGFQVEFEFQHRQCSEDYKIVTVVLNILHDATHDEINDYEKALKE